MNTKSHWKRALLGLMLATVMAAAGCRTSDDTVAGGDPAGAEATSDPTASTTTEVPGTTEGECVDGEDCVESDGTPRISEAPKVTTPAFIDFAAAADPVCIGMAARFEALPGIHATDGAPPTGLGALMVELADKLDRIEAPSAIAETWHDALAAFERTGKKFIEADELLAAGDTEGAGAAQSEALWVLPIEHTRLIASLGVPFHACFVEE